MQTSARSVARSALLAAQIGVALILVTNAVLLVRGLYRLRNAPTGIATDQVMTSELSLGLHRYSDSQQRLSFYDELERRLANIPGVTSSAVSDSLPPMSPARSMPYIALQAEGRPGLAIDQGTGPEVGWRAASPGYFSTLSIPVLRGRPFRDDDRQPSAHTIVVNQRLAQLLFGSDDPVGQHLRFGSDDPNQPNPWMTVVGVVANVGNDGLGRESAPEFFLPRRHATDDLLFRTASAMHVSVIVRSPVADAALSQQLREVIGELDPTLPFETASLQERVAKLAERPRFNAALLAMFAAIALLLATIGVYSVIALVVAQRTREIGIRMAIGATPGRILKLVLSQGMIWVFAGAMAGVAGTLATGHYLRALLFGVSASDPTTLLSTTAFLLLIAMLAIWIPARRAAQVDPIVALRHE
jgi:predicted permease